MGSNVSPLRWFLKKSARRGLASVSWAAGRARPGRAASRRARALTYHRFGTIPRDPFCVRLEDFDRQMAYLAAHGLAVSLDEVLDFVSGNGELKDRSVLVTIDDGYRSLYEGALPILERHGIPAVAFVNPSLIAETALCRDVPGEPSEPWMNTAELEQLADSGVTVGSHSYTHRSLGSLTAEEVRSEAVRSKQDLESRLERPIRGFAYPYGTRADFSDQTAGILRSSGYACAFTSQHGAIVPGSDPFALPRVKVEGGEGMGMFGALVSGQLDAWQIIDRGLWRIQAGGRG